MCISTELLTHRSLLLAIAGLWAMTYAGEPAQAAPAESITVPHVTVTYKGVPKSHAEAVGRTLSAAREAYANEFALALPETIRCSIECGEGIPTRLYTDGNDRVFLSIPSPDKLLRPTRSGTFVLYGMCHELGHVAMYRVLQERDWMSGAAAEGWAHYAGSVVVDRLFAQQGKGLWAIDPYDFNADGTARLDRQLAGKPSDIDRAAGLWRELGAIVGSKEWTNVFKDWQLVKAGDSRAASPADASKALLEALTKSRPDKQDKLKQWWAKAGPLFVEARPASAFASQTIDRKRLEGRPMVLSDDDGTSDGKRSIAGGGHAKRFAAPGGGEWYLTAVSVFGSRYGPPQAPAGATFEIGLCDAEMKPIVVWKQPQALFPRGEAKWVRVAVPPTRVPPGEKGFHVCLQFRPTATQGVFMHFDSSNAKQDEHASFTAIPGQAGELFAAGEWMIRAEIERPKSADALGGK